MSGEKLLSTLYLIIYYYAGNSIKGPITSNNNGIKILNVTMGW